jgi:hypothetical protein
MNVSAVHQHYQSNALLLLHAAQGDYCVRSQEAEEGGRGGGGAAGEGDRACDACDMAVADADDDASEASTEDKGRQHAGVGGSVDECDEPCDDGCLLLLLLE